MFKTIKCIIPIACISIVLLSGCVTADTQAVPPDVARNDECLSLKEQLVLNDEVSSLPNQPSVNPAKAAQLYKEYERLQCDAVLAQAKMEQVSKVPSQSKN